MYSDLCLSILNAYAQRFVFVLLLVVDSPRVDFTLSNIFPLLGPGMRVSHVDVSRSIFSCLLMAGQARKTLTLAYPYGSEPFHLRCCATFFGFSASIFGTYSEYRAPATLIILERSASSWKTRGMELVQA
jgi:hypothetical protein